MSAERVEDHYARSGSGGAIAARIVAAVRMHAGAEAAITPEALAPVDHLHGRGPLATADLVAMLEPQAREAILDIGSAWAARHAGSRPGSAVRSPAWT